MTQGFLETFSAELRSEKWNRGGGGLDFKWKLMREKYKNVNG